MRFLSLVKGVVPQATSVGQGRHRQGLSRGRTLVAASLIGVALTAPAWSQLPQSRLSSAFPTGGQRGTSFDISVAGTDLDEATELWFSHPGIKGVAKTQMVDGKPQPIPNTFTVTVNPDVPLGGHDLRVRGLFGLSNPRTFSVFDRKTVLEVEPNNQPTKPQEVELNTVILGKSDGAADVDVYKIPAKAGQRFLIEIATGRLDSRMEAAAELYQGTRRLLRRTPVGDGDVVIDVTPAADGEYLLRVSDRVFAGGAEYPYELTVHTGPRVEFTIPASGLPGTAGEVTLYGRNLPGGQPSPFKGADGVVLQMLKAPLAVPGDPAAFDPAKVVRADQSNVDAFRYSFSGPTGSATPINAFVASAPPLAEVEPNDTPAQAQKITIPVEITGQFQARRDSDIYQFEAKAGDVLWIEAYGRRNGNPSDPTFVLESIKVDDKGQETATRVTVADDNATNIGGTVFNTVSDDPSFRFAVPADGVYRLTVRDRAFENRGDPNLVYRLAVRRETPDFRLVAMPVVPNPDPNTQPTQWDLALRKGDAIHLMVMAHRRDGFTGDILVTAEGLPPGVTSSGASIGSTVNSAMLVLKSAEDAPLSAGPIKIVGKARVPAAAQVKALADAEAARLAAVNALPALVKAATDAETALKTATEAAAKAKEALDKDANNEALKKAKEAADAAATKAAEAAKTANDNKAAGDKKIVDANAAVAAARQQRDGSGAEVAREARGGTIVWNGNPGAQQAAEARVTRGLTLAVVRETSPYQLQTDALKFSVNAGSQILIPITVVKRAGFDNNVALNFVGPIPNVQVENKPINKGEAAGLYRVYLPNNTPLGTYTLFMQSTAQVPYSRNPEAAAAAAKEKEAADKLAVEKAEAAKKGAEAKAVADKKATDTAAEAKKAADAKVVADKLVVDTAAAAKAAADAKVVTDKAAVDAEAAHKAALDAQAKATEALNKDANNDGLKKAKADADAAVVKAAEALKKAQEAKVAGDKKATETAEVAKKAADAKVVSDKLVTDTDAAAKKGAEEKVAADKVAAETDAASKAAVAAKAAADKKATDTANVAKPATPNVFSPAAAIVVTVRQAPGTLAVAAANGAVKRGAMVEVKCTITRANGFSGPVALSLPLPPNAKGLTAAPVTIPADKTEGTLVIQAAGDATAGAIANLVVRASMDFDGASAIDQPLALTVQE